jgi:hypothetical protein
MLFDVRTYTIRPMKMKEQLELYDRMGRVPQTRHLGQPVLFLLTETGEVNTYLHIWAYENAADREQRRAALWKDPEWMTYVQETTKLDALVHQSTKLMTSVDFFPFKR